MTVYTTEPPADTEEPTPRTDPQAAERVLEEPLEEPTDRPPEPPPGRVVDPIEFVQFVLSLSVTVAAKVLRVEMDDELREAAKLAPFEKELLAMSDLEGLIAAEADYLHTRSGTIVCLAIVFGLRGLNLAGRRKAKKAAPGQSPAPVYEFDERDTTGTPPNASGGPT